MTITLTVLCTFTWRSLRTSLSIDSVPLLPVVLHLSYSGVAHTLHLCSLYPDSLLVLHSSLRCRIVPSCTLRCTVLWISLFQLAPSCGSLADSCRSGELSSVSKSVSAIWTSTCCALQLQWPVVHVFGLHSDALLDLHLRYVSFKLCTPRGLSITPH